MSNVYDDILQGVEKTQICQAVSAHSHHFIPLPPPPHADAQPLLAATAPAHPVPCGAGDTRGPTGALQCRESRSPQVRKM